jgi:DNA-binding transcriptional ArsR family regulator
VSLGQQRTTPADLRLAKAFSHPMRGHILGILDTRVASPNEIAQQLGERLANVSYHVRALLDLGCIELVRTEQRRGAIEHYYRGVVRPFFDDREWERLSGGTKDVVTAVTLRLIWDDVSAAIESGTFEDRSDRYFTRSPLDVDGQGWRELNALLATVLDESVRIAAESAERLAASGEAAIPAKLVLMHFESPAASELSGRARAARKA